jgi:hypothetical protein
MHHDEVRAHPFFYDVWHFQAQPLPSLREPPPAFCCFLYQHDDGTQEDVYDEELAVIPIKNFEVPAPSVKRQRSHRHLYSEQRTTDLTLRVVLF